jgi:putative tryptophan/tyrosine transport system substrate-binding protein
MRLIELAVVLAVSLALAPLAVEAQQSGQIYRIGFLSGTAADAVPLPKLRAGLRELGYVGGKTIVFEHRFAGDKNERLPGLPAELVRSKVDIIVAMVHQPSTLPRRRRGRFPSSW